MPLWHEICVYVEIIVFIGVFKLLKPAGHVMHQKV